MQNKTPPAFNVSANALILPFIVTVLGLSVFLGDDLNEMLQAAFGLNPLLLRQGDPFGLFTYAFVHGSFMAALFNGAMLLAFGSAVIRAMGPGFLATVSFFIFFVVCAVASGLAFCLYHAHTNVTVVGASAAVSGIVGAAIRMPGMWGNSAPIAPLKSRQVLAMTAFWLLYHGLYAVIGYLNKTDAVYMAWESHLTGYFLGLLLIEPWLRAFHGTYFAEPK
jgi:membrane associated rhomboid family serine protease